MHQRLNVNDVGHREPAYFQRSPFTAFQNFGNGGSGSDSERSSLSTSRISRSNSSVESPPTPRYDTSREYNQQNLAPYYQAPPQTPRFAPLPEPSRHCTPQAYCYTASYPAPTSTPLPTPRHNASQYCHQQGHTPCQAPPSTPRGAPQQDTHRQYIPGPQYRLPSQPAPVTPRAIPCDEPLADSKSAALQLQRLAGQRFVHFNRSCVVFIPINDSKPAVVSSALPPAAAPVDRYGCSMQEIQSNVSKRSCFGLGYRDIDDSSSSGGFSLGDDDEDECAASPLLFDMDDDCGGAQGQGTAPGRHSTPSLEEDQPWWCRSSAAAPHRAPRCMWL